MLGVDDPIHIVIEIRDGQAYVSSGSDQVKDVKPERDTETDRMRARLEEMEADYQRMKDSGQYKPIELAHQAVRIKGLRNRLREAEESGEPEQN